MLKFFFLNNIFYFKVNSLSKGVNGLSDTFTLVVDTGKLSINLFSLVIIDKSSPITVSIEGSKWQASGASNCIGGILSSACSSDANLNG